jgi:hypothetical protein
MTRSGRVNPAFTIYAWGLRLADHLSARLAPGCEQAAVKSMFYPAKAA